MRGANRLHILPHQYQSWDTSPPHTSQMSGQALGLQHIGQCLSVGLGVILVGTLTGAEDETVFLGLGQCQLVGDAVLLQVQQGEQRSTRSSFSAPQKRLRS